MKQSEFPEWARRIKAQEGGTSLKQVGNNIYLYKCTSSRIPGKKYPVVKETYLGQVTEEGLVKAEGFLFYPLETETSSIDKQFDIKFTSESDQKILEGIRIIKNGRGWALPRLTKKELETVQKYFNVEAGIMKPL